MRKIFCVIITSLLICGNAWAETVKIGLNYPKTGPYAAQGADQWNGTEMAVEDINAHGGILGNKIEIVSRDSQSKPDVSTQNANDLIAAGVKMIFGGSASSVAVAVGKVCQEKGIPFFGTLTYSTETTDEKGHRHTFRECYNSWAAAKVLAGYMRRNFAGKRYLYISADYTWGYTTESSFRKFTGTEDKELHKGIKTKFPGATADDFKKAIAYAKEIKPDVLVLTEFGEDMVMAVREAAAQGLKTKIVVPNLTLYMAHGAGPKAMEGVIGALDWAWNIPYKYNYPQGKAFVEKYTSKYGTYPGASANYCWAILHEYKAAVERAGSFDSAKVIKALEGHKYQYNKDEQFWRTWDHSSIQTVYAVRCKPEADVLKDKYKMDYFEVINALPGENAFRTKEEWISARSAVNMPPALEALPGEK